MVLLPKHRQQVRSLLLRQPRRVPVALEIVGSMKKHVVPSALIIDQKIGHAIPQQLVALLLAPCCFWILIVLSESHGLFARILLGAQRSRQIPFVMPLSAFLKRQGCFNRGSY